MLRAIALLTCLFALPALAAPERYRLDTGRSQVNFTYVFDGVEKTGQMPVKTADLLIDLDNLAASQVTVVLNARAARAGFIFATEAMKGPEVLNTRQFPEITFRSRQFRGSLSGATVTGDLTVRGVTRPVTLRAELYRQRGTEQGDRSNLVVFLSGSLSRAAYGATGHRRQVGDRIGLKIIARITK